MQLRTSCGVCGIMGLFVFCLTGCHAPTTEPAARASDSSVSVHQAYDVRDLLVPIPDFNDEPDFSREGDVASNAAAAPQAGLFADARPASPAEEPTRQEMVGQLTHDVKASVDPAIWAARAAVREEKGQLIVDAPVSTQRELATFLNGLRHQRSIQVAIEARILNPTDALIEKLDGGLARKIRLAVSPLGAHTGIELSDEEAARLIAATEPPIKSPLISAPRITLFNGQRAYVLVSTQKAFTAGYTPKVGGTGFDPQTAIAESGVIIAAQAGVPEDEKHVAVNLSVTLSDIAGMGKTPFTGAPADAKLFVDVPNVHVRALRTTVSVASGHTVILGAFRDVSVERGWRGEKAPGDSENVIVLLKPTVIDETP